jgi:hypothetical protein
MKMIPVQHLLWLGTGLGNSSFTFEDQRELVDYEDVIEEYGVEFSINFFQYEPLPDAIVQAAEYVHSQIVFAKLPTSILPFWSNYQLRWLRRCLSRQHCELCDQPTDNIDSLFISNPVTTHV